MNKTLLFSFALGVLLAGLLVAPVLFINIALVAFVLWLVADMARGSRRSRLTHAINTLPANWGTHVGGRSYFSSAALATRFLLGKLGADKDHIAVVAATADEPLGVMTDEASAAEEAVGVEYLALSQRTLPMVAAGVIAIGVDVYSTAAGKIDIKPTAAGTYWKVGRSLEAATADGDVITILPQRPRKLIVVSALESANGALGAATGSVAAQAAETEKLGDDVRKLAAALDAGADVALATT